MNEKSIISFSRRNVLSIHNQAMAIAKNLKNEYKRLFEILLVIEEKKIYFEFDIPDFRTYCKEMLELSDSIAREFGIVVRKSLEVPQLAEAIRSGKVSIYKARRISSVITEANHKEWLDLAAGCTSRIVERAVALANPRDAVPESLKYVAGDVLDFRMGVNEEWAMLLERTKDILSQKCGRAVSAEEATFALMSEYCRKNDPLEKAKRTEKRKKKNEPKQTKESNFQDVVQDSVTRASSEPQSILTPVEVAIANDGITTHDGISAQICANAQDSPNTKASAVIKPKSRYRPAEVEHQVDLRDGCQCTHIDKNGKRCVARRWLQKHHIIEFADGGEHTVENLVTLCWAHHKIKHLKSSIQTSHDLSSE